jgi:hypothetical protein
VHQATDVGPILKDSLAKTQKIMKKIKFKESSNEQVWNPNTHLSVDLKTLLRSDSKMKAGKDYQGILRRDEICEEFRYDEHFTFVETVPKTVEKRNPQVYVGEFITITRRDNGTYRPNFRPMKMDADFSVEMYATGVANELLWALEGLIGKR